MPIKSDNRIDIHKVLNTIEDKKIFLDALLNPPSANNSLKNAQSNYKKFVQANENTNKTK